MNRTRSNRPRAVSISRRNLCRHRRTDKHSLAFAQRPDGCIPDRSGSIQAASRPRADNFDSGVAILLHPAAATKVKETSSMISLVDLQRRIASGDLSADAAIAQTLETIRARDKSIGAFVCRADQLRPASAGPLRGIAVGIKDIMDTADFPTEMGSPIYRGHRSARRCGRGDAAEAGRRRHRRQDHDHGVRFKRSDARRSIRTTTLTRRAARRRARRRRSRPA